jgi:hypothetical protein
MKKIAVSLALCAALLLGGVAGVAAGAGRDTDPGTTSTPATDTTATGTTATDTTSTAIATTTPAPTVPPINYGVADDTGKYADDGGAWFDTMLKGANLTEVRWTLAYNGDPTTITELPFIQRAAPQAEKDGVHVVLALYARPARSHDPSAFCTWAAMVANTVKQWGIHDFIVWNEPNTSLYWSPQDSSAPAGYEALLATCYDAIHAADSEARVIGMALSPRSNGPGQTAPIPFILAVGAAYRASGRTTPIMDQMSIHPYPNPSSPTDGPDVGYKNTDFYGVPNFDRVKQAVYVAFHGTGQPTTLNGLTFRVDELGWQTATSQYAQYFNNENVAVVSEQTQALYVQQAVRKYLACDPTVTDVEWFLLVDEPTRSGRDTTNTKSIGGGWQSGFLTAGGEGVSTQKVGYALDAPLFSEGRAACTAGMVTWAPQPGSGAKAAKQKASNNHNERKQKRRR